jgi:uncharacterized membrane protein
MQNREIKHFFRNGNNMLNKGHTERDKDAPRHDIKIEKVLPPIEVISEYESLSPGSLEKAIHISQKEQNHRHEITQRALTINSIARITGQLFGVASFLSICFVVVKLAMLGMSQKAIYIATIYLTGAILISIFGIYAEKASRIKINRNYKNKNKGDFRKNTKSYKSHK